MKKTVVIGCAGKGSRLGKQKPKCLVEISGKTILERQLELLKDVDEIIIVVGYKGDLISEYLKLLPTKIKLVYNYDYENTSAGASIILGADAAKNDMIIAIVGDLIIYPPDMDKILSINEEFACGGIISTENPIYIKTENEFIVDINRENGDFEWSGLAGFYKQNINRESYNLYNIVQNILPIKVIKINAREVDTIKDLEEAERWINSGYDIN